MHFNASARGHHVLAYNSSRLYVIDVLEQDIKVKREFKIRRRPALACVADNADVLAVISDEMQVDVYILTSSPPKKKPTMILDSKPRAIALSACGSVLAIAYDHGIEVSSLVAGALSTDRRAVKCDPVDSLAFSFDGTQLLGTTVHTTSPCTVVITAPYFDPGNLLSQGNIASMWTTSILFPNTSHDSSHAVLLQNGTFEEATWAFTYDRSFEAFRAIRIEDLRNGTTYFTGPAPKDASTTTLLPCTLPATTYQRQLAAAGFDGKEVWIYGIPEDLDAIPGGAAAPTSEHLGVTAALGRHSSQHSNISRNSSSRSRNAPEPGSRTPQWQVLCDKQRNNIVTGCKVSELPGLSNLNWVEGYGGSSLKERLIATARGVSGPILANEEEDIDFADGGRIVLIDFDFGFTDGKRRVISIELGSEDVESLEEEKRDLETEVAIVRRRTVAQRRNNNSGSGSNALLRAATTAGAVASLPLPEEAEDDPLIPRRMGQSAISQPTVQEEEEDESEGGLSIAAMEALDAPYAHASPRSTTTLRRAATAAAVNRARNPRTADGRPIEYRRADGRREHPHPADGDNWVPPPPPYQADDPGDLPPFLRGPAVAPLASPPLQANAALTRSNTLASTSSSHLQRRQSRQRTGSDSTTYSARPRPDDFSRPKSSPSLAQASFQPFFTAGAGASTDEGGDATDTVAVVDPEDQPESPVLTNATGGLPMLPRQVSGSSTMGQSSSRQPSGTQPVIKRRPVRPTVDVDVSPDEISPPRSTLSGPFRGLATTQTWPLAPQSSVSTQPSSAHPVSAVGGRAVVDDTNMSLPPAPSSEQLARLNRHSTIGLSPRSSGFQTSQWHAGPSETIAAWHAANYTTSPNGTLEDEPMLNPNEERPLIISTPSGVSGAYDSGKGRLASSSGDAMLAPVPRRPRANIPFNPVQSTTAVQPIYSAADVAASQQQQQQQQQSERSGSLIPAWLSSPPATTGRQSVGVSRKPSRAERSAAKNMHDARKKGWRPKSKKGKAPQEDHDWTDVSPTAAPKDKKCVVM